MKIQFKNIQPGIYSAKITEIKKQNGPYGQYMRFNFKITEGELIGWEFYGIVKPTPFKQSKFFRWCYTILGYEPNDEFNLTDLIGKICKVKLDKKIKNHKIYYSVSDLL